MNLLYTHWPVAPSSLGYDDSCHLHASALNRAPSFFKDTEFFVDELHF